MRLHLLFHSVPTFRIDFQVLKIVDDLTNNKQSNGKGRAKVFKVDRKEIDGSQGSIALKKIYKTGEVETARNRFLAEVTSSYHLSKVRCRDENVSSLITTSLTLLVVASSLRRIPWVE